EHLLAVRAQRREAVALRPAPRRAADAAPLHASIGGGEPRQQAQLLLPRTELGERVPQPDEALAHALDLVRQQAVLPLERAAPRDADAARDGGAAQHEEQERDHTPDPDQ